MYLFSRLILGTLLAFSTCVLSETHDPSHSSHSPLSHESQTVNGLSINLDTEIHLKSLYAEITHTYSISNPSEDPLELFINLPHPDHTSFISLSATLDDQTKKSLIVDSNKLRQDSENTQPESIDFDSAYLTEIGILLSKKSAKVTLLVVQELESEKGDVWRLDLHKSLFSGPFLFRHGDNLIDTSDGSVLEKWHVEVIRNDDRLEFTENSGNQGKKAIVLVAARGDDILNQDYSLKFQEKKNLDWNVLFVEHEKYNHDYVLYIDIPLQNRGKTPRKRLYCDPKCLIRAKIGRAT